MNRQTRNGLIAFVAVALGAIALVTDLHRIVLAAIYPHAFELYKFLFWY